MAAQKAQTAVQSPRGSAQAHERLDTAARVIRDLQHQSQRHAADIDIQRAQIKELQNALRTAATSYEELVKHINANTAELNKLLAADDEKPKRKTATPKQ